MLRIPVERGWRSLILSVVGLQLEYSRMEKAPCPLCKDVLFAIFVIKPSSSECVVFAGMEPEADSDKEEEEPAHLLTAWLGELDSLKKVNNPHLPNWTTEIRRQQITPLFHLVFAPSNLVLIA